MRHTGGSDCNHCSARLTHAKQLLCLSATLAAGTCLLRVLGARHLDNLAAGKTVPQAITGHHEACALLRNLDLHDVWVRNDAVAHVHVANGARYTQAPRPRPKRPIPGFVGLCCAIHVHAAGTTHVKFTHAAAKLFTQHARSCRLMHARKALTKAAEMPANRPSSACTTSTCSQQCICTL